MAIDEGVRWFYWGLDEWCPFESFESAELEAAYHQGIDEVGDPLHVLAKKWRVISSACWSSSKYRLHQPRVGLPTLMMYNVGFNIGVIGRTAFGH